MNFTLESLQELMAKMPAPLKSYYLIELQTVDSIAEYVRIEVPQEFDWKQHAGDYRPNTVICGHAFKQWLVIHFAEKKPIPLPEWVPAGLAGFELCVETEERRQALAHSIRTAVRGW
jgi:hypothetical protein